MGSLSIKNIRKSFGPVEVLKDINLDVSDGEFVIFVGPSGCGKSTLLRIIAGLEDSTSGSVLIDGAPVDTVPPAKRGIAMVFQTYALYPHLTVRDNMGLGLKQAGTPRDEIETRVAEAARMLSLGDYLKRRPAELSGGQRQRVAIGRAVVREPKLFLFDEPLSNLDAKLRVQMRTEIKELHQRLKTTTVFVTHDQVEAMTMADKIVVMHDGIVEQIGTPLELYDSPKNLFVAAFIGSPGMNLIKGTAKSGGTVDAGGANLVMPGKHDVSDGQPIVYGIRPEHLDLADDGMAATVAVVEPTGAETHVLMRIGESEITAVFRDRHNFKPGQTVHLKPRPEHAHLFDSSSGSRV